MAFTNHLVLWLHIGVAIFTIGPATAAIMSTPRYIRKRDAVVVGHLHRTTRIYAIGSLLVFVFGLVLAQLKGDMSKPWVSFSMALFVVAIVLLVLIDRDQGAATAALRRAAAAVPAPQPPAVVPATTPDAKAPGEPDKSDKSDKEETADDAPAPAKADESPSVSPGGQDIAAIAAVERGRIVSLGGVTSLIWLVILILMVWKP